MSKELIVSSSPQETKAAILEGGEVVEIHIEREGDQGIVGSICKGRVAKVLPGMQSAFVNVGLERDAFLYVSDFFEDTDEYDRIVSTAEEQVAKLDRNPGTETAKESTTGGEDFAGSRNPDRRLRSRRARRGRLRGKRQETPSASAAAPPASPPPAPAGPPRFPAPASAAPQTLSVLPGESLAKYAAVAESLPAKETESAGPAATPTEELTAQPEARAATGQPAATEPSESAGRPAAAEPTVAAEVPAAGGPSAEPEPPPLKGRRSRRRPRQTAAASAAPDSPAAAPEEARTADTEAEVRAEGEAATAEAAEATAEATPSGGDSEPAPQASSREPAGTVTASAEPQAAAEENPPAPPQEESAAEEVSEPEEASPVSEAQAPPQAKATENAGAGPVPASEVAEPAAEAQVAETPPGAGPPSAAADDDDGDRTEASAASTETDPPQEPAAAKAAGAASPQAAEATAGAGEGPSGQAQPDGPGSTGQAAARTEAAKTPEASSAPASRPRPSNAQYRSRPNTPRFFRRSPDRRRSHYRGEERQRREAASPAPMIADLLKEGQEILVQIAKEPLGTKGARITSHIAIPGRYLVYMPTVNHIGVSRKISSSEERQRLRKIILDNRGDLPGGFIVRTAGEHKGEDEFKADIGFLRALWTEVKSQSEKKSAPAIIHRELNLVQRILRDQFNREFSAIRVDNELAYASIVELIHRFQPGLVKRVKLYTRDTPIFEEFGVQAELDKALRSKVWLKSGGYIVIDQAEALVAIDVNTGKYVGKSNKLEDTIAKTNVEAAREIARQLRLRDLGGIIVCDFIDMEDRKNRLKVTQALETALRRDKSPSKVLQFNDFGLVAITRKRVKQSLLKVLCEPCSQCCGSGMVKSPQTVCYEIQGEARKMAGAIEDAEITFRVNPAVAKALKTTEASVIDELESSLKKDVVIKSDPLFPQERFDIF